MSFRLELRPNRMARIINPSMGLTAAEAVSAAEKTLAEGRDGSLRQLAGMVDAMQAMGKDLGHAPTHQEISQLYDAANAVFSNAGLFGMVDLGAVAYSLCVILDQMQSTGYWDLVAVRVHLDSLNLVNTSSPDGTPVRVVLQALKQLVERVRLRSVKCSEPSKAINIAP